MRKSFKILRGVWLTMILGLVAGGMVSCEPYCVDCKEYRIDGEWSEICVRVECDY